MGVAPESAQNSKCRPIQTQDDFPHAVCEGDMYLQKCQIILFPASSFCRGNISSRIPDHPWNHFSDHLRNCFSEARNVVKSMQAPNMATKRPYWKHPNRHRKESLKASGGFENLHKRVFWGLPAIKSPKSKNESKMTLSWLVFVLFSDFLHLWGRETRPSGRASTDIFRASGPNVKSMMFHMYAVLWTALALRPGISHCLGFRKRPAEQCGMSAMTAAMFEPTSHLLMYLKLGRSCLLKVKNLICLWLAFAS